MPDKLSGTDLFSLDRAQRASSASFPSQSYAPYAEAWKEFDKLQKAVNGGGPISWVYRVFDGVVFGGGVFGFHIAKKYAIMFLVAWVAFRIAFELMVRRDRQESFVHWKCPRCHAEWPGTKTEKNSRCATCRLSLHQMWS